MVTGVAPYTRMVKAELLGNDNKLDESANQYDFIGSYGERFFDNFLGLRADVHAEKRIMSNEYQTISRINAVYTNSSYSGFSYTNALRKRNGGNILLDFMTPDGGSIKFNNSLYRTNTDYFESKADTSGIDTWLVFRDREIEQHIFLSSLTGNSFLFGFDVDWSAAFSESKTNHPFDYSLDFSGPPIIPGGPHLTYPDFLAQTLDSPTKNYCKEKTASLDVRRKYAISDEITGALKFGGKYRTNLRSYNEDLRVENTVGSIHLSHFQYSPGDERILFNNYKIPLIDQNALRLWRQQNYSPYYSINRPDINSYNSSECVAAGYVMHDLNFGQWAKFITGVRIESEHNDCSGYYFPYPITDYPDDLCNDLPKQTKPYHSSVTTILPNFQMILRPTDFLNLRLAAYKTLIRPDCIARMPKYYSFVYDWDSPQLCYLHMGNPGLKNADVWNYEFQTQFYGNGVGQLSINVFYKNIEGMVQATNGIQLSGTAALDSFGINWRNYTPNFPFNNASTYYLFSYFNSPKPTRIWGLEVEHQANFRYLPGFLKNIVLNYNFSFSRSETWTKGAKWIVVNTYQYVLTDTKQKISNMPDLLANVNLGYGINGFSFRISYFYRDEYPMYDDYFGAFDIAHIKENKLSRLDVAVKQQIVRNFSVILRANNITNSEEETLAKWTPRGPWQTAQAYRSGPNYDFGVGINL